MDSHVSTPFGIEVVLRELQRINAPLPPDEPRFEFIVNVPETYEPKDGEVLNDPVPTKVCDADYLKKEGLRGLFRRKR